MFPFKGIDEDQTFRDLMIWQQDDTHTNVVQVNDTVKTRRSTRKPPQSLGSSGGGNVDDDENSKKMLHREIERQRRQEMASLYSSLRTLLPLEHIKGKRSVSDHMDGAVSYIKQMQNKISELRCTRDELKKVSSRSNLCSFALVPQENYIVDIGSSTPMTLPTCSVRPCSGGIEILCSSDFKNGGLISLSRMLQVIFDHGLAVTSCVSTQVDTRFLHTINTEECDVTCMDLSGLQQKLVMALAP